MTRKLSFFLVFAVLLPLLLLAGCTGVSVKFVITCPSGPTRFVAYTFSVDGQSGGGNANCPPGETIKRSGVNGSAYTAVIAVSQATSGGLKCEIIADFFVQDDDFTTDSGVRLECRYKKEPEPAPRPRRS